MKKIISTLLLSLSVIMCSAQQTNKTHIEEDTTMEQKNNSILNLSKE